MLGSKIETLLAVAEFQNFTKAAASLSLTQPAVSHHINQLEEELGVTLFIRGKGRYPAWSSARDAGNIPCPA